MADKTKTRAIFEEVAEGQAPQKAETGQIDRGRSTARGAIRVWLIGLGLLVALMISVGGLTRLTDSGLSITEWAPVTGAVPPLTAEDWDAEFERYRQIPEYQLQNAGMTLAEFKVIYWWEWGHRQLGRVIGLVWAAGFLWFLIRRQIPVGWTPKLLSLGVLGGLQGAIGWWMVSSGLTGTMLDVASYRLATHLGLAFVIIALITWYVLQLGQPERALMQARRDRNPKLWGMSTGLMHFAFLQILIGALVAGIDAGRSYTEWPLMGGRIFPPTMWDLHPWWRNLFENAGTVQFFHRVTGYLLLAYGIGVGIRAAKAPQKTVRGAFGLVGLLLITMVVVGVITVIYAAPLHIAIVHQFIGILLWVAIVRARFNAGYPTADRIAGV